MWLYLDSMSSRKRWRRWWCPWRSYGWGLGGCNATTSSHEDGGARGNDSGPLFRLGVLGGRKKGGMKEEASRGRRGDL
jgi:hypothetical protein